MAGKLSETITITIKQSNFLALNKLDHKVYIFQDKAWCSIWLESIMDASVTVYCIGYWSSQII